MWKRNEASMLAGGVPPARGKPDHIETEGQMAQTDIDNKTGKVVRMFTPPDAFRRTHEMMHARHTDVKKGKRIYKDIIDPVYQITEDCWLHLHHWPWHPGDTPDEIKQSARSAMATEMEEAAKHLAEEPEKRGTWPDFATRLRQVAVNYGLGGGFGSPLAEADFVDRAQRDLAAKVLTMLRKNKVRDAAKLMQLIFAHEFEDDLPPGDYEEGDDRPGIKRRGGSGSGPKQPHMEIIELPQTEIIPQATVGYRRATSGARLHRPSLRKPVLPQRLFLKRTPREPGGTILVDASGSMGDWNEVVRWCEKAPYGTIAYYAGNGTSGKLFVYARNGKRAREIVQPGFGGNTVDGPAMTWLLTQAKPRLMITDRGFCDVADSDVQIMRLAQLERAGEIIVKDYAHEERPE